MNQDEIVEMARQAGFSSWLEGELQSPYVDGVDLSGLLKHFAKLVEERTAAKEREEFAVHAIDIARRAVAEEREACAKVCDKHGKVWGERMLLGFQASLDDAAKAIRARGGNKE